MVNSIKRLNKYQIIGVMIEILSFIGCCLKFNSAFVSWFWIGTILKVVGTMYFMDKWSKEGETWYKDMDKKRDKNITIKSSKVIFFIQMLEVIIVSFVFIAEFVIKDFSKQFSTIMGIFILTIITLIILLAIVERTSREMELIISAHENKKRK